MFACSWYVQHAPIPKPVITAPAEGISVPVGSTQTASCTCGDDLDKRMPEQQIVADTLSFVWSGDGNFSPGTGASVNWTAPTGTGDATISVTADDSPKYDDTPVASDPRTVTVVAVDKIQYNDPDSGYVDAPGTLYVMKGTTVTFKAIPDPAGAAWPDEKPAWGGSSGASGTGATKAVTFDTTSSTKTDYRTVTAECGNTVTVNVVVHELTGYHEPDDWFPGRAAGKYGVAEKVHLSFTASPGVTADQMGGLLWIQVAGSGDLDDGGSGLATYYCHWTTDSVTLRLTVQSGPSKDKYVDMGFSVIPPNGAIFVRKPGSGLRHFFGLSTCGFLGWAYLRPTHVSFTRIDYGEGTCDATLDGWFADKYPSGYPHPPNGPIEVGDGDSTDGCRVLGEDMVYSGASYPACLCHWVADLGDT